MQVPQLSNGLTAREIGGGGQRAPKGTRLCAPPKEECRSGTALHRALNISLHTRHGRVGSGPLCVLPVCFTVEPQHGPAAPMDNGTLGDGEGEGLLLAEYTV
jgi:hypothetical protein